MKLKAHYTNEITLYVCNIYYKNSSKIVYLFMYIQNSVKT